MIVLFIHLNLYMVLTPLAQCVCMMSVSLNLPVIDSRDLAAALPFNTGSV